MSINGKYSITQMEVWGDDVIHMDGPAFIEINGRDGRLHFVCVDAFLDIEHTADGILFSWEGHDDGHPISGAGIAQINGDLMTGRLLLHRGDHSNFTAVRCTDDHSSQGNIIPFPAHNDVERPPGGGLDIEVCPEWDKRNKARLALPWAFTFDDLANGILQALDWESDHLYQFCLIRGGSTFRQQMLRSHKILGPMVDAWEDVVSYTDAPLAEFRAKLEPKAVLYFHFDFGDDHYFRIVVKKHLDKIDEGELIKAFPKAIEQYPQWGDEDEDEDE